MAGTSLPGSRRMTAHAVLDLAAMSRNEPSSNTEAQVVSFRRYRAGARRPATVPPPVEDLTKYQHTAEADDYRHRMIVNLVAFVFVVALIGAGLWLADTMALMRSNEDCVLSGRHGCTQVEYNKDRW